MRKVSDVNVWGMICEASTTMSGRLVKPGWVEPSMTIPFAASGGNMPVRWMLNTPLLQPGSLGRDIETDIVASDSAGMIGGIIHGRAQTSRPGIGSGRDYVCERRGWRPIEKFQCRAVTGTETVIAHAKLIARKIGWFWVVAWREHLFASNQNPSPGA